MAQAVARKGFEGWLAEELVATIESPSGSEYRVNACVTMQGAAKVNMREFYYHRASGEMRPGKVGFSLHATTMEEIVPALSLAVERAMELAKEATGRE